MSFARVNPSGWAVNDPLTSAQMNQLDINVSRAGDLVGGGDYTPGAPFNVNGSGFGGIQVDTVLQGEASRSDGSATTAGRVLNRIAVVGTLDAVKTLHSSGAVFDLYVMPYGNSVLSANRANILDETGAVEGEIITIQSDHSDATYTASFATSSLPGAPIGTFAVGSAGLTAIKELEYRKSSGAWIYMNSRGDNVGP